MTQLLDWNCKKKNHYEVNLTWKLQALYIGLLPGPKAEFNGVFDSWFDLLNGPNEVNKICFYMSFYVLDRTGPLN